MKPKLDYLIQYPVDQVLAAKDGGYSIMFSSAPDNEIVAEVKVAEGEAPEEVAGLSLLQVEDTNGTMKCTFGRATPDGIIDGVITDLPKGGYTVADTRYDGGAESDPHAPEEDEALPDDPSPDRVADGPTEPQEDE